MRSEPLGAVPTVAIPEQLRLRRLAGLQKLGLEELRDRRPKHVLAAGMLLGERIHRRSDRRAVEVGACRELQVFCHAVHGYNRISNTACAVTKHSMQQPIHAAMSVDRK